VVGVSPLESAAAPNLLGDSSPVVVRPNGDRVRWYREDLRFVVTPDGRYFLETDVDGPIALDRVEVVTKAAQLANWLVAVAHDHALARRLLDHAIHGDDPDAFVRIAIADQHRDHDGRGGE
jgi:hypothetical protein